jgi:hypothetical protein
MNGGWGSGVGSAASCGSSSVTDNALRGAGVSGFGSSAFAHTGDGSGALHTGHGAHEQGWSEHGRVVSDAQQRPSSQTRPHACTQPSAARGVDTLTHSASIHRTHRCIGRLGIFGGLYLTCNTRTLIVS